MLLFPVTPKPGVLYAVFANRNSTALFFVLAIVLLRALPAATGPQRLWCLGGGAALALGTVLTQSRSGMALLAIVILLFSLSTLMSYSYYGLKCARYVFGERRGERYLYFYLGSILYVCLFCNIHFRLVSVQVID